MHPENIKQLSELVTSTWQTYARHYNRPSAERISHYARVDLSFNQPRNAHTECLISVIQMLAVGESVPARLQRCRGALQAIERDNPGLWPALEPLLRACYEGRPDPEAILTQLTPTGGPS